MKKPVVLRIYKKDQLLGVKQFLEPQIVIGRPGDVQLPLEGESVSIIHAAIEERDVSHYICDLGSETGTFRNGEAVLDQKLESGDILQVGEYRIEFFVGAPKPKTPPSVGVEAQSQPRTESKPETPAPVVAGPPIIEVAPANVVEAQAPVAVPVAPEVPAPISVPPPVAANDVVRAPTPREEQSSAPAVSQPTAQPVGGAMDVHTARSSFSLAGPRGGVTTSRKREFLKKKRKGQKTFAPPSKYSSIRDYVKPSKGSVVEILLAWRERVISTYHFSGKQTVTMGSHPDCDIVLPVSTSKVRRIPFVQVNVSAMVLVSPEMTGELISGQSGMSFVDLLRSNRMMKTGELYSISLEQGEMIRVDLGDGISLIVRYVSDSPKPLFAPLFDFTVAETTGVVLSFVLVGLFWLYMSLYSPGKILPEEPGLEPVRTAVIILPPTPPPALPPPSSVEKKAEPVQLPPTPAPKITKATPSPKPVEVPKVEQKKQMANTNLTNNKKDPGKSAAAAPSKNKTGPTKVTSVKQGGEIKTSGKAGSQMASPRKNVEKAGLFSTFGGGGAQDELAQQTSGSGELAGLAGNATGRSGFDKDRAGTGLGSEIKDTGRGGDGKALQGISGGLGTTGRGSGVSGYGTGGLGDKSRSKIVTGGTEESYSGTIDREAIRRVVMNNLRVIKTCYERQLNRNPDLLGKVVLTWEIGEQGRVLSARVKSNALGNDAVAECIIDRLKTWRFPEPPGNQVVEVSYPFFFSN